MTRNIPLMQSYFLKLYLKQVSAFTHHCVVQNTQPILINSQPHSGLLQWRGRQWLCTNRVGVKGEILSCFNSPLVNIHLKIFLGGQGCVENSSQFCQWLRKRSPYLLYIWSYLGTEQLGPKQRPLAGHGQVDSHTFRGCASTKDRPLSGQTLREFPLGQSCD